MVGGVIDRDRSDNIAVVVFNNSDMPFEINKGDKIAQLICERISSTEYNFYNPCALPSVYSYL